VDCFTDTLLPEDTYINWTLQSPSGDALALAYTGQGSTGHQGLCMIQLQSGDVTCSDTPDIEGYLESGAWSPDSRFFLAMYSPYGPNSDDKTGTRYAIFNAADGTYQDVSYANWDFNLARYWRPALNP
jgi:hypothetical protein